MNILIIGGNRFFGRHLASELLKDGITVALLNRGKVDDGFGDKVERLIADRTRDSSMTDALKGKSWDLVYDQICYTAQEARSACRLFEGKTKRFVVTSSESIYGSGLDQKETNFLPETFSFKSDADRYDDYQGAKRQVEAVFTKEAQFETAIVRPSLVVGVDDYTGRLKWHLDRVRMGLPIYFPKIEIQSDFIRSDQAGLALKLVGLSQQTGTINCTTRGFVSLQNLISMCENALDKKAHLVKERKGDNHSPYGGTASKTMNTDLLYSLGFQAPSSAEWLGDLISQIARST
jgi:nucleoside-diphosphate-sugar epimerase